jgi:hypothetical protein
MLTRVNGRKPHDLYSATLLMLWLGNVPMHREENPMSEETYNGYPNYETWRIANDVIIDYADSLQQDNAFFESVSNLAENFRSNVEALIEDTAVRGGFAEQLAYSLISTVRWHELAENFPELLAQTCDSCGNRFSHTETNACRNGLEKSEEGCDGCSIEFVGYCRSCASDEE